MPYELEDAALPLLEEMDKAVNGCAINITGTSYHSYVTPHTCRMSLLCACMIRALLAFGFLIARIVTCVRAFGAKRSLFGKMDVP